MTRTEPSFDTGKATTSVPSPVPCLYSPVAKDVVSQSVSQSVAAFAVFSRWNRVSVGIFSAAAGIESIDVAWDPGMSSIT
jgi:hypothetical protein